jgi:retinoblastoma-like protein 1
VHRVGDFDERIFSSPDALTEIGTPVKATFNSIASFEEQKLMVYPARRNLQSQFDGSHHLALATPLTGRNFLKAKEPGSVTPVSTATQSVSRLQALVSGRQTGPSEELRRIFSECSNNPGESIQARVKEMGEKFCAHYVNQADEGRTNGFSMDMARKRLQLGESLYYKVLEKIIIDERRRLKAGTDLSGTKSEFYFHFMFHIVLLFFFVRNSTTRYASSAFDHLLPRDCSVLLQLPAHIPMDLGSLSYSTFLLL